MLKIDFKLILNLQKDLQKRNKQEITAGDPLNLNAVDSQGELICPTGT